MKLARTGIWTNVLSATILLCAGIDSALASDIITTAAGTYTGVFEGTDFGTVTIAIDTQNNVTCDFFSTSLAAHFASSGGVTNLNPLTFQCTSPTSASYQWSAASDPNAVAESSITGFWGDTVNGTHSSGTFTANYSSNSTAPASSLQTAVYTGFWYDPNYSGSGFDVLASSAGLVVAYYGWDAHGNRLWLTSSLGPTVITPGTPINLDMSYTTGGVFTNPQHNAAAWGTLSLNFSSCSAGTAVLSGTDGTLNLNLALLVGTIGLPGC